MKKLLFTLAAFTGTLFAATGPSGPIIEKNIREIPQDGFFQLMNGQQKHLVVKFSAGDSFPIGLHVSGSLVDLREENASPYRLVFKKDIYVYIPEENTVLFSTDKERWQPFMEFITGNLSVYTNFCDKSNELTAEISFHADKR
ncbi:hypothetical protein K0U07_05920 [bacterium]|nr:hypothetical protein [bacterium]